MKSISLEPELNELYTLNEFVLSELGAENLQVNFIVEEIFVNIVNYSKTKFIKVNIEFDNALLTIEFIDNGVEFNPLLKEKPELPENIGDAQIGGLGIFLTKEDVDNSTQNIRLKYDYADFSICISSEEIWIIEHKGKYSLSKQRRIENEILPKENKARKMKDTNSLDEINEWYSNQIEEIINTSLDDILTVYKVIL